MSHFSLPLPNNDEPTADEITGTMALATAATISDQLSAIVSLLETLFNAVQEQNRKIDAMASTLNQVSALGDQLPPDLLKNLTGMFGA